MSAAVAPVFGIAGRNSQTRPTQAGWVGSAAGSRGHFVKVDASGYIDHARAAGGAFTPARVGVLNQDVASTVLADSDDAKLVHYAEINDGTEIELPLVTNSNTFVDPANTHIGDLVGLYRRTTGDWAYDTNTTDMARVIRINEDRGTVTCKFLATVCLP
jgi:hypothetical protein